MRNNHFRLITLVFLVQLGVVGAIVQAPAQAAKAAYPAMAPVDQYLIADRNSEIALARTAAPASISAGAEVMVLGRSGIHDRGKRNEWLSLFSGARVGRFDRHSGLLESKSSLAYLL